MPEWLLAPIDASRGHDIGFFVSWHGRLMVAAWGALIPLGIVAARYFKVMPGQNWPEILDNTTWWTTHQILQYTGVGLSFVALLSIVLRNIPYDQATLHRVVGWLVVGLAISQILAGWLRGSKGGPTSPAPDGSPRGDHFDMTRHRVMFEYLHKSIGHLLMIGAVYCILSGLWAANAPTWMWLSIGIWWLILVTTVVILQRRGLALDTYQAIWGPDPNLPGNRRRPIGLGIRKVP